MVGDATLRSHHPGSPLYGGRTVTSSGSTRPVTSPLPAAPAAVHSSATPSFSTAAPLAVQVEIRFPGLNSQPGVPVYVNEYTSSADLAATNRLCKGLLKRLHHCSTELITRKDSRALKQHRRQGHETTAKPLRYEIHFRVHRQGAGVWAERTFSSYQRQALADHEALEIILATHRMIGLFLRRHDPSFHWTDVPSTKTMAFAPRPDEPELVRHTVDSPLPLACVPQSRFLDESQSFEFTPGYAINLTFRSRCHGRKQYEWKRVINLQSKQNAPLNLAMAESLLWDTFNSVNSTLSARREAFLEEHKSCDFLEGVVSCQHFGEDALDIELGIENKLGPNFNHLKRSIESKLGLFRDPDARDCQEFFLAIHGSLVHARDSTDGQIGALPDFDLRILTLSAPTWSVENPARFVLDTTTSYSRRSVEAILDRVQTGVSDVLRNRDCTIHLVAYKRGHLVLDKALIARPLPPKPALFPMATAVEQAGPIVARLTERIHRDLNAVCKDTCSLNGITENASDEDLGLVEASRADEGLPECSVPTLPLHGAFEQTIILEDPTAFEDEEPAVPAPRVVELPDDVFVDALEHAPPSQSPVPSTRRRAFPLMPEKFTLPHSRSSSSVESAAIPAVEPVVEEDVDTPTAAAEAPAEPLASAAETVKEPSVEIAAPVDTPEESIMFEVDQEDVPSPQEHDVDISVDDSRDIVEPCIEEPQLPVAEIIVENIVESVSVDVAETTVEETTDDVSVGFSVDATEVVAKENIEGIVSIEAEDETYEAPISEPVAEISSDEADDVENTIEAGAFDNFSNANGNTTGVEEQAAPVTLDSPPMFITFDDLEEQPSVELRFGRPGSPTVGTPLETIFEYDSDPDTEFAFELPSYGQFVAPVHDEPATSKSADKRPALSFAEYTASESAAESSYESAPETNFKSHSVHEFDMQDSFAPSSAASQDGHDESYLANITVLTTTSSDCTRPSTPSLSLSSGEVHSPEMSMLDTPNFGRERHAAMICFDSDGSADFEYGARGGYEADSEPDNSESGHFGQLLGENKSSGHSLANQSLFGQSLAVPIPSHHCDLSEAESTPTEIWHGATTTDDVHTSSDNMEQLLNFDSDAEINAGPSLARSIAFKDSFEDFAMTKPTLDLDEYAEIVVDSDHDSEQQLFADESDERDDHQEAEAKATDEIVLCNFDGLQEQPTPVNLEPEAVPELGAAPELKAAIFEPKFSPEFEAVPEFDVAPIVEVALEPEFDLTREPEALSEPEAVSDVEAASGVEAVPEVEAISEVETFPEVETVPEVEIVPEVETFKTGVNQEPTIDTVIEPGAMVEPEHPADDKELLDDAVDTSTYDGAESIPLPESDEGLEEILDVEEAETPTLAKEVIAEAANELSNALASDVLPEADAVVAIDVDDDASVGVVSETETVLPVMVGTMAEDKLADEAPIVAIVEVTEETITGEEPESDSVSIQHVEFAAVAPVETEVEHKNPEDTLVPQDELPTEFTTAKEVAESEDVPESIALPVANEPLSDPVEESDQSPQSWLQLTVPETETTSEPSTDLQVDTSLIPSELRDDDMQLPLAPEDDPFNAPVMEEFDLASVPATQEVQVQETDSADDPREVAELAPVMEDKVDGVSVPDMNNDELAAPLASTDVDMSEPIADIIDEVHSVDGSPVDAVIENDMAVKDPSEDELEKVTESPVEAKISTEANEQPACEVVSLPELPQSVAMPKPVLHVPAKDNVELGAESGPSSVTKSILNNEQMQVFHTEMKSLSLDSALGPTALDTTVQPSPAPEKCDLPVVEVATRDSIDSIHDMVEPIVRPTLPKRMTSWSLPRSGLLGLNETRLANVGIRSALTGSHAFDNVPFSIKKRQQRAHLMIESPAEEAEDVMPIDQLPTASLSKPTLSRRVQSEAVVTQSKSTLSKVPKRTRSASVSSKDVAESAATQEGILPRVVIAFASMAIMSQMINKSS
ncbi:hypothetical protein SBRCBS47491_006123 [Sporothrix bragantina]|uniref:Pt repeat family protein n=1 Tax=Sporothrix bragantina TaxID=671064 RepID=A0ABP0C371_9PEZI